ncbi:MAG TPA: VOC family protein [Chloroflexia bacterium]|nr:VOC family protein [Chloroflexia bacterium]
MAGQPIVHIEIPAKDLAAGAKFYADAFGWELRHEASVDYWMFQATGGPGGGFIGLGDASDPAATKPGDVLIYIASDDIDADLAKVESLGGKKVVGKTEIPQTGWFGVFTDPTGNRVALYKEMHPPGAAS